MIKIDLLKNHPHCLPRLSEIWQEVLGKIWAPDISVQCVIERFTNHLNDEAFPLTFIALDGETPIGMCSLRENDGIRPDLSSWLGSLVVDPSSQKRGIAKMLIDTTKEKAKTWNYNKLYLFAFNPTLPGYYAPLGWSSMGMDIFTGKDVTVMEMNLMIPPNYN